MVEAGNVTGLLRNLINAHGKEFGIKSAEAVDFDELCVIDIDDDEHYVTIK